MRQARGNAAVRKVEGRVLAGTLFWLAPPDGGAPRFERFERFERSIRAIRAIRAIDSIDGGGTQVPPPGALT